MTLALYTHADMLGHVPPGRHPESPARLTAVIEALADADLGLETLEAPLIAERDLALIHTDRYLAALRQAAPDHGARPVDEVRDTWMSPGSAAGGQPRSRRGGGGGAGGRGGRDGAGLLRRAAARPPRRGRAADGLLPLLQRRHRRARAPRRRAWRRSRWSTSTCTTATAPRRCSRPIRACSSPRSTSAPGYPGTGDPSETGVGNIVNATVPPGAAPRDLAAAFESADGAGRRLRARPDPDLGRLRRPCPRSARAHQSLEAEDFAWATRAIVSVAHRRAAAAGLSPRSRAVTTCRRSASRPWRMCGPYRGLKGRMPQRDEATPVHG